MTATLTKASTCIVAGISLHWALHQTSGVWVWLMATLAAILFLCGIIVLTGILQPSARRLRNIATNILITIAATGLIFTSLELLLPIFDLNKIQDHVSSSQVEKDPSLDIPEPSDAFIDPYIDPEAQHVIAARGNPLTMPQEWKKRRVEIPGAKKAYYWHGALHVRDENRFRRTTPFPDKNPDTFRIIVAGDSLTYGLGIDEKWTYPAVLESRLRDDFNIEVINLGVSGYQSEDILGVIETWLPILKPDLVIYGMCLNDFLPTDTGQEVFDTAYSIPLPRKTVDHFIDKTQLGSLLNDRYDALLRKWNLRQDFFDGILADLESYQARFADDVARMNKIVTSHSLPPIVGLVLHQLPRYNGPSHQLTRIAEDSMLNAGFTVVQTEDYFRHYNNQNLQVSNWEGHPNEVANQIFADMLEKQLRQHTALQPYRI